MNKLTKLMLASAVLATSGFATSDVVVDCGGVVNAYNDTIDVSVTVGSGGSIAVHDDVTLNKKLVLEAGSTGTIESGKTLENKSEIVMTWDTCTPGVFAPCGGEILQTRSVMETQCYITRDVDGCGEATWYVYYGNAYDAGMGADCSFYMLNKAGDLEEYDVNCNWYSIGYGNAPVIGAFNDMSDAEKNVIVKMDGGRASSCTGVSVVNYGRVKASVLKMAGVNSIGYYADETTNLAADSTDFTSTNLSDKNAKKLERVSGGGFGPDIPGRVAPIQIEDPNNCGRYLTFGSDMVGVSSAATLQEYFDSFGVSFKQSDGSTDSTVTYGDGQPAITALLTATSSDAVLIDNTEIAVGDTDVTVGTNLHNIGVTCAAPTFAGTGVLTLTGDNRLLKNATFANPTTISGANALPTNAVFNGDLTINNDVAVGCGNSVTVNSDFSVAEGKSVSVAGILNLGSAPTEE